MIRKAIPDDLEPLTDMMMRFTEESNLKLTYDREQIRELTWKCIHIDDVILLVADNDGELAGMVAAVIDDEFSLEPCAYINKFYVEKSFRGTPTSHELLTAFDEECKNLNIALSFASSTAGMGELNEKLYVRLFEHHGYETLGRVLIRDTRNE